MGALPPSGRSLHSGREGTPPASQPATAPGQRAAPPLAAPALPGQAGVPPGEAAPESTPETVARRTPRPEAATDAPVVTSTPAAPIVPPAAPIDAPAIDAPATAQRRRPSPPGAAARLPVEAAGPATALAPAVQQTVARTPRSLPAPAGAGTIERLVEAGAGGRLRLPGAARIDGPAADAGDAAGPAGAMGTMDAMDAVGVMGVADTPPALAMSRPLTAAPALAGWLPGARLGAEPGAALEASRQPEAAALPGAVSGGDQLGAARTLGDDQAPGTPAGTLVAAPPAPVPAPVPAPAPARAAVRVTIGRVAVRAPAPVEAPADAGLWAVEAEPPSLMLSLDDYLARRDGASR
jgi:Meckel syndrome type 1 protein